jgi:hypothetical protein
VSGISIALGQFDLHILMMGGHLFPRWIFSATHHQDVKSVNVHVSTVQQASPVKHPPTVCGSACLAQTIQSAFLVYSIAWNHRFTRNGTVLQDVFVG